MNLLLALAPLVVGLSQTPAAEARSNDGDNGGDGVEAVRSSSDWTLVAGIAAQAGDRIFTLAELESFIERQAADRSVSPSDPGFAPLAWDVLDQALTAELEPQAGQDMGFDTAGVDQYVRQQIRQNKRAIGATGFVDRFLVDGTSFQDLEENEQAKTYRQIWQSQRLGGSALPGMRPIRDRHIRPGELRTIYEANRTRLNPDRIRFQSIFAPVSAFGDAATARVSMEDVRRRALDGEDFGRLVDEFSAITQDEQGIGDELAVPDIAIPELRAFADTAVVGDVSPVVEIEGNGQSYLVVARVHAKTENVTPDFGERNIQQVLRRTFANERDYRRLGLERGALRQRSFVWITPRLGYLQEAAQRAGRRN